MGSGRPVAGTAVGKHIWRLPGQTRGTNAPQEEIHLETSPARIVKKSAEEYDLPCCVCGKTAVALHPAGSEEKILRGMICAGIARSVGLNVEDKEKIFAWLENGDLAAFHDYMAERY